MIAVGKLHKTYLKCSAVVFKYIASTNITHKPDVCLKHDMIGHSNAHFDSKIKS